MRLDARGETTQSDGCQFIARQANADGQVLWSDFRDELHGLCVAQRTQPRRFVPTPPMEGDLTAFARSRCEHEISHSH